MKISNTISISFDKSDFKDLLICEMVNHIKENWEDNQLIDLFLHSDFKYVGANITQAEKVKELIFKHKTALKSNTKIDL